MPRMLKRILAFHRLQRRRPLPPVLREILILCCLVEVAGWGWISGRGLPLLFSHVQAHGWSLPAVILALPLIGAVWLAWEFKKMADELYEERKMRSRRVRARP